MRTRYLFACLLTLVSGVHGEPDDTKKSGPDAPKMMDAVRLQIVLDRANFRPGKLDGLGGEFTKKAEERYRLAYGLTAEAPIDLSAIANPYREYVFAEEDTKWIGPQADKPEEQSKLKSMPYADGWELIAEKFHCDIDFLRDLNPDIKETELTVGTKLRVPDVEEFSMADVKGGEKKSEESEQKKSDDGDVQLTILRDENLIEIYQGEKLIGSVPCTPGSTEIPVEVGDWKIDSNVRLPDYRWDKSVLETGKASKEAFIIPPGPNNAVGVVWMGINRPRVGIHGTNMPDQIGRNQSSGCIRTANWDALLISKLVKTGTPVQVR